MKKLLLIISLFISISNIHSQNDGDIDPTFTIGDSLIKNGIINATALQTDGKVIASGNFLSHDGIQTGMIIRLNSDGSTDSSFNTAVGFNNTVSTIAIQADGKILAGGSFTDFNGTGYNYIIRLNSDGSVDSSFTMGSGFNTIVKVIKVLSDGKILIAGSFTTYNGTAAKRLVRLNPDGSIDNTLSMMGTGFTSADLRAIAIQPDGKMIIGGYITAFNGSDPHHILRLNYDGSKDTTFTTGTGFDNTVYTISLQANGQIIVGGSFTTFNGGGYFKSCIRLNSNGTRDIQFPTSSGFNGNVYASAVLADGRIILGGHFSTYRGNYEDKIIRLNADGTKDASFLTGTGMNADVNCVLIQPDDKILVGGEFNFYNGIPGSCLIRLNADGVKDSSFEAGLFRSRRQSAFGLVKQADGKIIAVGDFTHSFGNFVKGIVRFNTDGTLDTSFNTGSGANFDVQCAAVQSDGKIVVGGKFTSFNGIVKNYIIRLNPDGSNDVTFNVGTGFSSSVYSLAIQSDGKIVAAGLFRSFNGYLSSFVIRLNTDGSRDTAFTQTGSGFDDALNFGLRSVVLQPDGKILVTGIFNNYNGLVKSGVLRLNADGTLDTSFNYSPSSNDVWSSLVLPSGKILVGGQEIGAKLLNPNGSVDTSFNSGVGFDTYSALTFAMQPSGKIIMGGSFYSFEGMTANRIIRFNPDLTVDTSFNSGIGFESTVYAVLASSDDNIIAGGNFTTYNGVAANGIVKLQANNPLSISNHSQAKFSIYPNPVKDFINIKATNFSPIQHYEIYDVSGKRIRTGTNPDSINADGLVAGYYILKLIYNDGTANIKFIKE